MTKKIIAAVGMVVLGLCLVSGGCSLSSAGDKVQSLKDWISIAPEEESGEEATTSLEDLLPDKEDAAPETIAVNLYYADADGQLVIESRSIEKTEGIGRKTIESLLEGPALQENQNPFPVGTRLLDINVKPDGTCIVDLSSEVRNINSIDQEKLVVYSIVNTLANFSSVQRVSFMIGGEAVDSLGGYLDLSAPVEPDYTI